MEAYWETLDSRGKIIPLTISCPEKRINLFADVISAFYELGINIIDGKTKYQSDGVYMYFRLEVDRAELDIQQKISRYLHEHYADLRVV